MIRNRAIRWLGSICSVISVVICLSAVGIWISGFYETNRVSFSTPVSSGRWGVELVSYRNRVGIFFGSESKRPAHTRPVTARYEYDWSDVETDLNLRVTRGYRSGFGVEYCHSAATIGAWTGITCPAWWMVIAAAAMPLARGTWRYHRRRRSPTVPHACEQCGYDLRASPDRCPECGTEVKARVANP